MSSEVVVHRINFIIYSRTADNIPESIFIAPHEHIFFTLTLSEMSTIFFALSRTSNRSNIYVAMQKEWNWWKWTKKRSHSTRELIVNFVLFIFGMYSNTNKTYTYYPSVNDCCIMFIVHTSHFTLQTDVHYILQYGFIQFILAVHSIDFLFCSVCPEELPRHSPFYKFRCFVQNFPFRIQFPFSVFDSLAENLCETKRQRHWYAIQLKIIRNFTTNETVWTHGPEVIYIFKSLSTSSNSVHRRNENDKMNLLTNELWGEMNGKWEREWRKRLKTMVHWLNFDCRLKERRKKKEKNLLTTLNAENQIQTSVNLSKYHLIWIKYNMQMKRWKNERIFIGITLYTETHSNENENENEAKRLGNAGSFFFLVSSLSEQLKIVTLW